MWSGFRHSVPFPEAGQLPSPGGLCWSIWSRQFCLKMSILTVAQQTHWSGSAWRQWCLVSIEAVPDAPLDAKRLELVHRPDRETSVTL